MLKHRYSLPLLAAITIGAGLAGTQAAHAQQTLTATRAGRKGHEPAGARHEHGPGRKKVRRAAAQACRRAAAISAKHPTINRWEYSNFIVYFEKSHVIHSVLNTPAGNNHEPGTAN